MFLFVFPVSLQPRPNQKETINLIHLAITLGASFWISFWRILHKNHIVTGCTNLFCSARPFNTMPTTAHLL
jgi:hypothetical protein